MRPKKPETTRSDDLFGPARDSDAVRNRAVIAQTHLRAAL